MTARRVASALGLWLLVAPAVDGVQAGRESIEARIKRLRREPSCGGTEARLVGGPSISSSYALPERIGGKRLFRVFFFYAYITYGGGSVDSEIASPHLTGRYDSLSDDAGACAPYVVPARLARARMGKGYPRAVDELDDDQFERAQEELRDAVAKASNFYFEGRSDPEARAAARDFLKRFETMSEPGLRPYYRTLVPDFWRWVRARTGRAF